MIIARFSPFFPNCTFLIMKSCLKSTAENQGNIGGRWGGMAGVRLVQVVLGGFRVVSDGFC